MGTDINRFRGKIFGGFNRRDVADYIEMLAADRNRLKAKVDELEGQVRSLRGENATLCSLMETERRTAEDAGRNAEAEYARKQAALEAEFAEKQAALEAEFAEKTAALSAKLAEKENALREELSAVMPLLSGIAADTASDAENLRGKLEELCDGLDTAASAAAEVCRRMEALEKRVNGEGAPQG